MPERYASLPILKKFQWNSGTWHVINFNLLKPPYKLLIMMFLISKHENRIIYPYNTRIIYLERENISRICILTNYVKYSFFQFLILAI